VRVVEHSFLHLEFSPSIGSWTWKNSMPSPSERDASQRDMKHDLHFWFGPYDSPLFHEESPKKKMVSLVFSILFRVESVLHPEDFVLVK